MISDYVKGKQQFNYSKEIQQGIQLHRAIDSFTDLHPATKLAKKIFQSEVNTYSGAFVDIVYDYFLANDKQIFKSDLELQLFATKTYSSLEPYVEIFPEKFKKMFPYMMAQNWLYNYKSDFGIEQSFRGLTNRAKYINKEHKTFDIFLQNKSMLQNCYDDFFQDVSKFVQSKIENL